MTNFTLIDYPAHSDTHNAMIKVRGASAIAAVVLPSEGVRLYYSELLSDRKRVNIREVTRGWPEPAVYFNGQYATTRDLYAKAYRTWTPMAAAAVDRNSSISPPEVHVFFVDRKSRLSRVVRKGTETWPGMLSHSKNFSHHRHLHLCQTKIANSTLSTTTYSVLHGRRIRHQDPEDGRHNPPHHQRPP